MKIKLYIFLIFIIFQLTLFSQDKPLEKVSLQLNWKHQFEFAGYYMAKEKGFYKEAGLDVELREYEDKVNIVKDVINAKSTFGITYTNVLKNVDKVVLLSAIFQSSPHVLVSLKSSHIHSIQDFKNRKIMANKEVYNTASILSMLHANGLVCSDMIKQKFNFNIESLINKETDIKSVYLTNETYMLDKLGVKYDVWDPKDYGFDFYDGILFTSKDELKKHPKTVENFTRASLKGWDYALKHIDETVSVILQKYNTQGKKEGALLYEARIVNKLVRRDEVSLGNINREKIQRILDIYSFLNVMKSKVNIDDLIYKMPKEQLSHDEEKYLQKKKVIKICVDPDWMPLEKMQEGKYVGIGSDYFKIFEKQASVSVKVVPTKSWSESIAFIKERKCDILSMVGKTPRRSKYVKITDSYISVPIVMVTKIGTPFVNNFKQLKDKRVAIVKDYAFRDLLAQRYPNFKIIEVKNIKEGIQKVIKEKVYAYVGTLPTISYQFQTNFPNKLKIVDTLDKKWKMGVAVRSDDVILYEIMQKIVKSVDVKEKQKILNSWISIKYEKGTDNTLAYYIVLIFVIIIIIGLYLYVKLMKLKNKIENQQAQLIKNNNMLKIREKELEMLVSTDPMTKLYNRRYFSQISESLFNIAKRDKESISIIMLDIDDFKYINDTYGHKIGDDVIISLSETLQSISRKSDIVCRFGGEEFIILLPKTEVKGAYFIAQKIKTAAESLVINTDDSKKVRFTVSLGVSGIKLDEDKNIEASIKRADDALYESKRSGKNRVTIA